MERKLYKLAVLTSVLGLLAITVIIISGASYPEMLFQGLAPIGLLLIFVSFGLLVCAWVLSIKRGIKSKHYLWTIWLLLVGIIVVVQLVLHR